MAWSNEEISKFQMDNTTALAQINATLRPDKGLNNGKVGVGLPGQMGDVMTAMSVLKYREELFMNKEIIWFANSPNADCLRYAPISEVRPWPWPGNGLPLSHPGDLWPILCNENNRLNKELAKQYELTCDLDEMYFPAPYMIESEKRHNISYNNCSKKVFGLPDVYEWHPMLSFSDEERQGANFFMGNMGGTKRVFIETFAGSSQSILDEEMVDRAIELCNEHWKDCLFIFGSHKFLRGQEQFPDRLLARGDTTSISKFTPRQSALISEQCDLMLSVSSGLTVAASAWGVKQPVTVQFCGSEICSTQAISHCDFKLVTADNKTFAQAKDEYYSTLEKILIRYK